MAAQDYTLDSFNLADWAGFPIYAAASNVVPLINQTPPADWADDNFGKISTWAIEPLDEAQTVAVGEAWLRDLTGGTISTRTAIQGLRLTLSIRSMEVVNRMFLLKTQERPDVETPLLLAANPIPQLNEFATTPFTARPQQVQRVLAGNLAVANPVGAADSAIQLQDSYSFLAAYVMKLLVKSPENVVAGVRNMKTRYESFYKSSRVMTAFALTMEQASAYKKALESQAKIILTYTHAIANTHQFHFQGLDAKEAEVLCYLCTIPFSYTGMHAYTLLMDIKHITKVELGKLLSLFHAPITAPALGMIHHIVTRHERTVHAPDRSVLFRYCTVWDPKYFQQVRSKQCVHLVYIATCVWKKLGAVKENSDPDRIYALNKLPESMKATLKRVGDVIGEILK